MYLVCHLTTGGTINVNSIERKISLKDDSSGLVGMCPVYKTKKQAMKEYPKSKFPNVHIVKMEVQKK